MLGMTVGNMIDDILGAEAVVHQIQDAAVAGDHQAPADDAGIGELVYEPSPAFPEDPVPADPVQEVPLQEAEVDAGADDFDPADFIVAPEDQPEDPPIIEISSDEEEEPDEDMEPEPDLDP